MTMTIPARLNKDIALMKLRALSGDADAAWQCGYALLNGKYEHETRGIVFCREDKREGLKWLKYAAEHGCAPAMLELGSYITSSCLCQGGYHDEAKLKEGLYWEKKAWRYGELMSALNIAVTYSMLRRNRRTVYWLHKAYDHCRWAALLPLAKAYLFGLGVRRNIGKASDILSELVGSEDSQREDVKCAEEYLEAIRLNKEIKSPTSLFLS